MKQSGSAVMGVAALHSIAAGSYAGEDNTIKVALVGCGGRGTGAAVNALSTAGPTKLWAVADVFAERVEGACRSIASQFPEKFAAAPERRFVGLDAYRKAIDTIAGGADVVILATPPAFRPLHLEYAVERGTNVFMEKSFAVDAPGVRRVLAAGEAAKKKNLKIAGGLMWRHCLGREALMQRIHDGAIGDVILTRPYRMHGSVACGSKPVGMSELAHQIRNYSGFTWLNGSFFVDWLIHDIDVCCWAKNDWPVNAQGHGGRAARTAPDQMYDHYAVEYTFADGTKMLAQGRHIDQCYGVFSDFFHGSKGSAAIVDAVAPERPRIYKGHEQKRQNEVWHYEGELPNPYQREHDLLFAAIRDNRPYNEVERCAKTCLTAIMGRMAAESGQLVTFEQALASELVLAPQLENYAWDTSSAPVMPDARGQYPIPVPGKSKVM
jgi:predicted dehydrogenase